jgi:hypothetical protein
MRFAAYRCEYTGINSKRKEGTKVMNNVKRLLDIARSLLGRIDSLIMLAIRLDTPSPASCAQNRVEKGNAYSRFSKFRSARILTPHGTLAYLLSDSQKYIIQMGRSLIQTSLDKISQLWNIQNMVIHFMIAESGVFHSSAVSRYMDPAMHGLKQSRFIVGDIYSSNVKTHEVAPWKFQGRF